MLYLIVTLIILLPSSSGGRGGSTRCHFRLFTSNNEHVAFNGPFGKFLMCNNTRSKGAGSVNGPLLRRFIGGHFTNFVCSCGSFSLAHATCGLIGGGRCPCGFCCVSFISVRHARHAGPVTPTMINGRDLFLRLVDSLLATCVRGSDGGSR